MRAPREGVGSGDELTSVSGGGIYGGSASLYLHAIVRVPPVYRQARFFLR